MILDVLHIIRAEALRENVESCAILSHTQLRRVVRARRRLWAELHRLGSTPTEIARAFGFDIHTVCDALDAPAERRLQA